MMARLGVGKVKKGEDEMGGQVCFWLKREAVGII